MPSGVRGSRRTPPDSATESDRLPLAPDPAEPRNQDCQRFMHKLDHAVSRLIRSVAATVVMPRFRNLAAHDIAEKSPGEIVTIADREAENRLAEGLDGLRLGARIVGEEACADDARLLRGLGQGLVWLVDPIDGTANFAAGKGPFGLMVALAIDGRTQAAWLYDPLSDRMCHAHRHKGAHINGERVRSRSIGRPRPVAALATQFMADEQRDRVRHHAAATLDLVPIPRCAAEHYPRLCRGENDIALFQRTLPWDHAAGALFLNEAGGRAARWDGSEYRIDDDRTGILAAATGALWDQAAATLFCAGTGLNEPGRHHTPAVRRLARPLPAWPRGTAIDDRARNERGAAIRRTGTLRLAASAGRSDGNDDVRY